jgi:hypothetical protein
MEKEQMSNIKMVSLKEYSQYINQMLRFGELSLKVKNMAFRFWKTIKYSFSKLTSFARYSARRRPSRLLRAL